MRPLFYLLCAIIIQSSPALAQGTEKNIHSREQLWFGALNQTRFSKNWGAWLELQYRMTDNFADRGANFLFRPAVTYFISNNVRANLGYALVLHYPPAGLRTTRTEHRPWQQLWWSQKYPGLSTLQWLRFEQRFNEKILADVREEGYNYNFRVRYNFALFIPLKGKELVAGTPFAAVINEIFINLGDRIVYNTFDQNRLFAGFGYNFTSRLNAQLGYMNIYQQEPTGNNYISTHTLRLFLFHTMDLSNRE